MGIMGLAEMMDKSVEILRKNIKTVIAYTLTYGVISFAAAFILILAGLIFAAVGIFTGIVLPVVLIAILSLFAIAFFLAFHIGLIKISSQEFLGEGVYTYHALAASFRNMLKVSGIVAVETLLFIPVIAVFTAIGFFLYAAFDSSTVFLGTYGLKEVVLIIFSIIAVLFAIAVISAYLTLFCFSLHAVAIENKGVFGSLKRSFDLVKTGFWKIFGCVLLFNLTLYAINLSLNSFMALILGIVYLLMKLLNMQIEYMTFVTMTYSIVRWPLDLLSWLVIGPIGSMMLTLLYFNQRFRKEGFDLELRLKQIQRNDERKQTGEIAQ